MADEDVIENEDTTPEEEHGEQQPEGETEKKAREMGWKPPEEWDGDTDSHLSAEEFIKRNERLKGRGDEILKKDNARLESELSKVKQTLTDLTSHLKKADKRAYEKARKDIESEMRTAVEEGDTKAYDAAKGKMDELQKEAEETAPEAPETGQNPDEDPAFHQWWNENSWYNNDVFLTKEADQIAPIVAKKNPGLQGRAFYDAVTEELKAQYPDRFGNPKRKKPSSVEGASNGSGGGKTLWDQVDKEGRAAFKRFVDQGVFEDTKDDREKYADDYLNG